MKKEMVFRPVPVTSGKFEVSRPSVWGWLKLCVLNSSWLVALSRLYARLLETDITLLQAFHLTHAQLAFFLMLFPVDFSVVIRLLLLGWFAVTLVQCRRSGLK